MYFDWENSWCYPSKSLEDETFDSLEVNTSTKSSKTSSLSTSKRTSRRNLMTEFSSDNIVASSPRKLSQSKISSSSASSSNSNDNDQWVTKMLRLPSEHEIPGV